MSRRLLLAAAVAFLGACTTAVIAAPSVVLDDYAVETPGRWRSGHLSLSVENAGEVPHTLVITDERGRPVAASELIAPGEKAVLAVDLAPGRYVASCRIVVRLPDGTLVDHLERGMSRTVDVG